jgi:hypothetical protein
MKTVKRRTDLSLDELEAAVQFAFSRLANLHERHLSAPSSESAAALKVARELWEAAKQELKSCKAHSQHPRRRADRGTGLGRGR